MRNRGRGRRGGRLVRGVGVDPAHVILTITDGAPTALVTTAAPHGLVGSESIVISGSSVAGYNGTFTATDAPTPTTFNLDAAYTSDGVGGRWDLA